VVYWQGESGPLYNDQRAAAEGSFFLVASGSVGSPLSFFSRREKWGFSMTTTAPPLVLRFPREMVFQVGLSSPRQFRRLARFRYKPKCYPPHLPRTLFFPPPPTQLNPPPIHARTLFFTPQGPFWPSNPLWRFFVFPLAEFTG